MSLAAAQQAGQGPDVGRRRPAAAADESSAGTPITTLLSCDARRLPPSLPAAFADACGCATSPTASSRPVRLALATPSTPALTL